MCWVLCWAWKSGMEQITKYLKVGDAALPRSLFIKLNLIHNTFNDIRPARKTCLVTTNKPILVEHLHILILYCNHARPDAEALLDIKLYWGTGPYSYPFFSFKLAVHNALQKLPFLNPLYNSSGTQVWYQLCQGHQRKRQFFVAFIWTQIPFFFFASCNIFFVTIRWSVGLSFRNYL